MVSIVTMTDHHLAVFVCRKHVYSHSNMYYTCTIGFLVILSVGVQWFQKGCLSRSNWFESNPRFLAIIFFLLSQCCVCWAHEYWPLTLLSVQCCNYYHEPLTLSSVQLCNINFPFSVLFIVGNEFCERFSYYGMRGEYTYPLTLHIPSHTSPSHSTLHTRPHTCSHTSHTPSHTSPSHFTHTHILPPHTRPHTAVLVLFLFTQLKFTEDSSTAIYHAFIMLCYLLPLLGALISDSCLGKYTWAS